MTPSIRICEYGRSTTHGLTVDERRAISAAAERWRQDNRLPQPPLYFEGADGHTLRARQYVGVVEAAGRTVEIYPKLDSPLLERDEIADSTPLETVMSTILWMLDVAGIVDAPEADTTQLGELPTDFIDLFALLLAKNLRAELARGMSRQYEWQEDDLPAVRGRIHIASQVGRNANRMDRLACVWDEFTPDTAINRLLRCACRHLLIRSRHAATSWLLQDCLLLLEDVSDVSGVRALQDVRHLRHWNRGMERFRRPFELACRLLRGFGHALESAEADTFVFLIDMNKLFESYVQVALAAHFDTAVETQRDMGTLLELYPGGIRQYADFYLRDNTGAVWIGDAKYKHLSRGNTGSATFTSALPAEEIGDGNTTSGEFPGNTSRRATTSISPDDVRQLTVYAELDAKRQGTGNAAPKARLMLLYPFVGTGTFRPHKVTAWNGSAFYLVPVKVRPTLDLANVLPPLL